MIATNPVAIRKPMKLLTDPQEEASPTSSSIRSDTATPTASVQNHRAHRSPRVALSLENAPPQLRDAILQCASTWSWETLNLSDQTTRPPDGTIILGNSSLPRSSSVHNNPIVSIRTSLDHNPDADVTFDFEEAARLGAWKLMSLENMPLVFVGTQGNPTSSGMVKAFQQACSDAGRTALAVMLPDGPDRIPNLCKTLTDLDRPSAIMADNDTLALGILHQATLLGIRVPIDLAILGCRDGNTHTSHLQTGLSSIEMDLHQAGRAAATLLRKWMRGIPSNTHPIRIPPCGIIEHESTRVPNTGGGCICRVVLKIRQDFSKPLCINSLARDCGMSVRSLYRRYRNVTGTTISKHLMVSRIQAAAELLKSDHLKLEPIAIETGLGNAKNLCRLFKEHFGVTPGQWRELFSQTQT
jgi:LacI family transcriptional regulator